MENVSADQIRKLCGIVLQAVSGIHSLKAVLLNLSLFARRDDFLMPPPGVDSVDERWIVRW